MTNCAGAIIHQSNRNVNRNIKMLISKISKKKKRENYHGDHKSIVVIEIQINA